jgi:hypothetical protein
MLPRPSLPMKACALYACLDLVGQHLLLTSKKHVPVFQRLFQHGLALQQVLKAH